MTRDHVHWSEAILAELRRTLTITQEQPVNTLASLGERVRTGGRAAEHEDFLPSERHGYRGVLLSNGGTTPPLKCLKKGPNHRELASTKI
jgi:hypothetical protein